MNMSQCMFTVNIKEQRAGQTLLSRMVRWSGCRNTLFFGKRQETFVQCPDERFSGSC